MADTGRNIVGLILEQAALRPDWPAVIDRGKVTSYGELARRASATAALLAERKVGPGVSVGVCADRSMNWIANLLGVLHSGGVYIPLNPMAPMPRKLGILDSASVRILLADRHGLAMSSSAIDIESIDGDRTGPQPVDSLRAVLPDQAAYGISTSGSTGTPKMVIVPHGSLFRYGAFLRREFALGPEDRYLQTASLEFSASIRQVIAPLVSGATVVVAPREYVRDPARLFDLMLQTSVTVLDTVPSYLARWLAEVSEMPANCRQALAASLKLVLTTGEPLMADTANSLFRTLPGVKLFNLYGQTETTGTVAIHHVSDPAVDPIAIGRIAADCGFYVLDSNLNPSQEGELFLFGPCLACGYQPGSELTANAFVPDPFGTDSGRTIYRTSDRVRRLADGVLQFIGRTDRQVKFHGIRIELGEIEATLLRRPEIHEAAVVMSTGPDRDARLVAFVAICPGSGPCEDCDLRAFVAASLGAVLTPGHIVFLETLPRTEGGKIDYPALLAYEFSSSSCRPSSRPPATPAERLVAKCWEEILRVPGLGREDDFFALGGDSLQAIQMLILVQKHLSARLPLGALFFREPTIGAFAKAIDEELA